MFGGLRSANEPQHFQERSFACDGVTKRAGNWVRLQSFISFSTSFRGVQVCRPRVFCSAVIHHDAVALLDFNSSATTADWSPLKTKWIGTNPSNQKWSLASFYSLSTSLWRNVTSASDGLNLTRQKNSAVVFQTMPDRQGDPQRFTSRFFGGLSLVRSTLSCLCTMQQRLWSIMFRAPGRASSIVLYRNRDVSWCSRLPFRHSSSIRPELPSAGF